MTDSTADRPWREAGDRPLVMGILNVTPDSFSDGGQHNTLDDALERALAMIAEGADVIDIGGESTRPNAQPVALDEELRRTVPVIKALRERSDVPVSIDTSKPEVMQAAVEAGASMINDVNALQAPDAVRVAARLSADVCLMHRQGNAATMQDNPVYKDVVSDVLHELQARVADCIDGGIERERLLLDPGFGFGKTTTHNLQLLRGLGQFVATSLPVLVGLSRKSLLQAITERPVEQRLAGSLALATMAAMQGARVIRVHDVAATVDAMKVVAAVTNKHEKQAD